MTKFEKVWELPHKGLSPELVGLSDQLAMQMLDRARAEGIDLRNEEVARGMLMGIVMMGGHLIRLFSDIGMPDTPELELIVAHSVSAAQVALRGLVEGGKI